MKVLRIYCKNCKDGKIDHPKEMVCPFCDGIKYKDIEYDVLSTKNESQENNQWTTYFIFALEVLEV